ncbi:MAG: hypothetical protein Q8909_14755, partial [Bacteroidota bacterium]|nr:hypothetical protein [Bacteroidota bacterium]
MKNSIPWKTKGTCGSLLLHMLLLVVVTTWSGNVYGQTSTTVAHNDSDAYVQTDLPDYAPGSTAHIDGEYWTPGEKVYLVVTHLSPLPVPDVTGVSPNPYEVWTVIADANGEVHTTWYVNQFEAGAQLQL